MKIESTLLGAWLLSVAFSQEQTDDSIMQLSEFAYPENVGTKRSLMSIF